MGHDDAMVVAGTETRAMATPPTEPRDFSEVMQIAELAVSSGLFGVKNSADAYMRMSTGMALGLSAAQSLRGVYTINGKVGLAADLMRGLCLRSSDCEYFRPVKSSDDGSVWEAQRKGDEPVTVAFGPKEAKRAGLGGGNYNKYPRNMFDARATAELARLVFPDVMHGLYTPEELNSIEPPRQPRPTTRKVEPSEVVVEAEPMADTEPAPAESVDTEKALAAETFRHAIEQAESETALEDIGGLIAKAGLPRGIRSQLGALYKARKVQLTATAAE